MRVKHNLNAMTASRQLNATVLRQGGTTEKLSSGLKINRAGDDAAGLSISEKMRSQIRALNQGSRNGQDGISLIQTAEGAMDEIHSMLQRLKTLSVQSANGTYEDEDRDLIEKEVKQIISEVDRIASNTQFNGMNLLDGTFSSQNAGIAAGGVSPFMAAASLFSNTNNASHISLTNLSDNSKITLQQVLEGESTGLNIIYSTVDEYEVTQTPSGDITTTGYDELKNILKKEIVPQAVSKIVDTYSSALGYLEDSPIGIGLKLENNPSSSAMASVRLGASGYRKDDGSVGYSLNYTLTVNLAYANGGTLTEETRTQLEATIAHEMVHALMDESLTAGMLGVDLSLNQLPEYKYPQWFKEGMAQTAAGGFSNYSDWVNGALGISGSLSISDISTRLKYVDTDLSDGYDNSTLLSKNAPASQYGTGYLACMYLGYLASGSSSISVSSISSGLSKVLKELISGNSLNSVINDVTGGKYTSTSDFENNFGSNTPDYVDSLNFVKNLAAIVGEGNGSLVSGDLTAVDVLPNAEKNISLFELDVDHTEVTNKYGEGVNVFSGGTAITDGEKPIDGYGNPVTPPPAAGNIIDLDTISGAGYDGVTFDGTTVTITKNGDYAIKGTRSGVNVVIADGVKTNLTFDNANVDSGVITGDGSDVTINLKGTNIIKNASGVGLKAGVGSNVKIQGDGILEVHGGSGAAGIGTQSGSSFGSITVDGEKTIVKAYGDGGGPSIGGGSGTINRERGIIIENGNGTTYKDVTLDKDLDLGSGTLTVGSGSTVNVTSSGKITGSNPISNSGTINNHGKISSVSGIGTTRNYLSNIDKTNVKKPTSVAVGSSLSAPENSTIEITYNGGQKKTLTGSWEVFDKDNNKITDFSGTTVGKDDVFTYKLTFNSEDNIFFNSSDVSSYSEKNSDGTITYSVTDEDVSLGSPSVGGGGSILSYAYVVTPLGVPAPGGGGAGGAAAQPGALTIQLGGKAGDNMSFSIESVKASDLGIDTLSVATKESAENALSACESAINKVSEIRAGLGAYQNRLEHSISSIDNSEENLQAAESRIRDTDMASSMMEYVKNQILIQAAQSILTQANNEPNGILSLLNG